MPGPIDVSARCLLVTGAGGFLGRALVRRLVDLGARVEALTRVDAELTDPEAVRRRLRGLRLDGVIHLAANTDRTRDLNRTGDLARSNVWGTLNLLQALPAGTPFLHAGTLDEYGAGPAPFQEDQSRAPASPYALTKMAAGYICPTHGGTHVPRSLVYGPGQGPGFLVPQLLDAWRTGAPLAMTQGAQQRDFLWLDEAVEGLIRLVRCPQAAGSVVNLCTGIGTSLRQLVELLGRLTGGPLPVRLGALPYREGEVFQSVGSPALLERLTGWRPEVRLEDGLRRILEEMGGAATGAPGSRGTRPRSWPVPPPGPPGGPSPAPSGPFRPKDAVREFRGGLRAGPGPPEPGPTDRNGRGSARPGPGPSWGTQS